MQIVGYCDYCSNKILEERDLDGEVEIVYTCRCNEETEEENLDVYIN